MTRTGRKLASVCLAAALAVAGAGMAFADIKGFNAAVQAGDYRKAAVEAKTAWASWDRSDPDTATVAREFGFASYVAGDFAAAREYGIFLRDNGKTLAKPDDQPASSAVLLAAAEFRLGASEATRAALINALKAREAMPGIDNISVLASEAVYKQDWGKADWPKAVESAGLAWRLIGRAGPSLALRALDARSAAATADFFHGPDKQDYDSIVDAHDAVVDAIDAELNPQKRLAFAPLKYQLEAWSMSMINYFDSGQQTGTSIPIRVKARTLKTTAQPIFPDAAITGDQCETLDADFTGLRYPQSAMYKNMVGTVIMKLTVNEQGRVSAFETLAAVPARHFAEAVEKALPQTVFRPGPGSKAGCSIARSTLIYRMSFARG